MKHAVILDAVRCDGGAHGGCQALCQSIFKEAWLTKVPSGNALSLTKGPAPCTEDRLFRATRRASPSGEARFVCQATEMKRASAYLAWWDPRQYVRDLRSGNVPLREMIRVLFLPVLNTLMLRARGYRLWRWLHHAVYKLGGRTPYLEESGRLTKTPKLELHLQPGELVRVKGYDEIIATLDTNNKNRGLRFDVEMVKYCGGTYRVLTRVERIIDEHSGRMITLPNDCIILDGVTTRGDHHRFYSQNEYPFWREIWLTRVSDEEAPAVLNPARNDAATSY